MHCIGSFCMLFALVEFHALQKWLLKWLEVASIQSRMGLLRIGWWNMVFLILRKSLLLRKSIPAPSEDHFCFFGRKLLLLWKNISASLEKHSWFFRRTFMILRANSLILRPKSFILQVNDHLFRHHWLVNRVPAAPDNSSAFDCCPSE